MGACYERCYKKVHLAENEFTKLIQKQPLILTNFSEIQTKIVKNSEVISVGKDKVLNLISRERYLDVLSDYFSEEDFERCNKIFDNLALRQIKKKKNLTTDWALFSILPFCRNNYHEKIYYFLRILLIPYKNELLNEEIEISEETTCNLSLISNKLADYLRLHTIEFFHAFILTLDELNYDMKKSIEFLRIKVFTNANVLHYLDKMLTSAGFPKKLDSEISYNRIKALISANRQILLYHELSFKFINDYDY